MRDANAVLGRLTDRLLGLPEAAATDIEVVRDLRVRMADGTVLLADRYRPRGVAGPLPVVLLRTPYGKHRWPFREFNGVLARRGFQVVVQDTRGTFGSGGEFRVFHQEKDDGLATVAWLREQPWCDGRLATAGVSYLGFTQWAIGPYADPPLEAMCLGVTASQFVSTFYPGGVLGLYNMLTWSSLLGTQEDAPFDGLLPRPLHQRRVRRAMRHLPVGEADVAAIGKPEAFLRAVTRHAEPGDDHWAPTDHGAPAVEMTTPTSMVTGWWDLFLRAQLRDFTALQEAGRPTRITIGPWGHDFGAVRASLLDAVSWLGAHLNGDTARLRRAPVRLYLQNAGRWLDFERWPPAEATPTPLYLRASRGLGWETPPLDESDPDAFTCDPSDPTPTVGGPLLNSSKSGQQDNREVEARPDVLVYTGPPLDRDLDLIGQVTARVFVRTDPGHADVFVRLCDVDERGVSRNVTDGILRLRPGTRPGEDGEDGEVVEAEVDLHPTGYRFRRGHRLRVQVAGGAFPRFARNHGTGEPTADAVKTRPIAFEVFHDLGRPSAVLLPVVGAK